MRKYQITTAETGSVLVDTVEQLVAVLSSIGSGSPDSVIVNTVALEEPPRPVPAEEFFV